MKAVLDRIVGWNLLVSGVAVSLALASFVLLGVPLHFPTLVVVGAGTFLVYTLDRRLPYSPEDGSSKRKLDPLAMTALAASPCAAGYACMYLEPAGRLVVGILAACSVAYILPLLPGKRRLKDVPHVKGALVSFGWGASTVLLPATAGADLAGASVALLFVYRLLYLTPTLLLSDWPDREADLAAGIRTVANQLSERALLRRCMAVAIAAVLVAVLGASSSNLPWWVWLELPGLALLLLLARSPLPSDRRFYLLVVDGLAGWPGIPALALYAGLI